MIIQIIHFISSRVVVGVLTTAMLMLYTPPLKAQKTKKTGSSRKVMRVVIDPGHGGEDEGAVFGALKEKVISLKIAFIIIYN